MANNEREIDQLNQQLSAHISRREARASQQERIRQQLEAIARDAVGRYEEAFEALLPQAEEKVSTVIQPWFQQLADSGTYDKLLDWVKGNEEEDEGDDISLSKSILYIWPNGAIRELRAGRKPFDSTASFIVKEHKDESVGIERHKRGDDEVWRANFLLGYSDRHQGIYITRWPTIGAGYGFSVGRARSLEIPVDHLNVQASLRSISPEVWIGFAGQIESGQAWRFIQESLKP